MADYAFTPLAIAPQGHPSAAQMPAGFTGSPKLRTHAVTGTAMAPTLRCGDFALLAPVTSYQGEGVYLVDDGGPNPTLLRVQNEDASRMRLTFDAIPHAPVFMDRANFDDRVLAMVVAEVRVTEPHIINQAVGLAA